MQPGEPRDPSVAAAPENLPASRRCWRCLKTFACAPSEIAPGQAGWWLCEPCQLALIGPPEPIRR